MRHLVAGFDLENVDVVNFVGSKNLNTGSSSQNDEKHKEKEAEYEINVSPVTDVVSNQRI